MFRLVVFIVFFLFSFSCHVEGNEKGPLSGSTNLTVCSKKMRTPAPSYTPEARKMAEAFKEPIPDPLAIAKNKSNKKLSVQEFTPTAVFTLAKTRDKLEVGKMIDGDLSTYASLLDESRNGSNPKSVPPNGKSPTTIRFVLDLGKVREVSGLRFIAQKSWAPYMARNVSVWATGNSEGTADLHSLVTQKDLPAIHSSNAAFLVWNKTTTRYLLVQINSSWEEAGHIDWWQNTFNGLLTRFNKSIDRSGLGNRFLVDIAEISCFDEIPDDWTIANRPEIAVPAERIQRDWMYQDCGLDVTKCFSSKKDAVLEKKMIETVLKELSEEYDEPVDVYTERIRKLNAAKIPGCDSRWKTLYFEACQKRRAFRLQNLREETEQFIYVKHYVFGGWTITEQTEYETDEKLKEFTPECRAGGQLCLAAIGPDGSVKNEVLIDKPNGCVRDPCMSPDGKSVYFSMRENFRNDNFHLYRINLDSRKIEQITFEPVIDGMKIPCTDTEPCMTAAGKIIFQSTRCAQIDICKPHTCSNLYTCDLDGGNIMRLGFDQLHTFYPQVLPDGRVTYTRWEYIDRNPLYIQPLLVMNADGTSQTEYYGNNSMYPVSVIHARGIPNSSKIMAIISGHHVLQKGALAIIDRSRGTQGNAGIEFLRNRSPIENSVRELSQVENVDKADIYFDFFGHDGPQYQYPWPFDEENFLVGYNPEGYFHLKGRFSVPFGVYFMSATGPRELLAFDWTLSCCQPVPVKKVELPLTRSSQVNLKEKYGTCFVQNIYEGPGLNGIPRGTIKKLRVVAVEYRAGWIGNGENKGEAGHGTVHTPISFNSGSWDVKHVLGEVDIESDGSAAFFVPARTPVYFQLLDEKGRAVQSMRSWTTLMPGEQFGCIGCHENKNDTARMTESRPTALALKKAPKMPINFDGTMHPLLKRLKKESPLDSVDLYLGVNAIRSLDPEAPSDGFSYRQRVQPILDRHCVECHNGELNKSELVQASNKKKSTLCLTGEIVTDYTKIVLGGRYSSHLRAYTKSYLALTNNGSDLGSKWITWLNPRARAAMLPPKFCGSTVSSLMNFLEPSHFNVKLSDSEKRTVACWIDLAVPFCGSYTEANTWTQEDKDSYDYYQKKRVIFAEEELKTLKKKCK